MLQCALRGGTGLLLRCLFASLDGQEQSFAPKPAAVAGKAAVLADDAMARNQNANTIHAIGPRDGSLRRRLADAPRQFVIGNRLAVRNQSQLTPNFFLEGGSSRDERERELTLLAFKVAGE